MTDEAIAHLKRAVELNPNYAEAHRFLGVILLYSKSQPDEAMPHFRAALEINPAYAEANNYLGIALLQKGREREAAANFQMAIEIQPDYTLAENNLAWLLATSPDAAIRNGIKAIELAQKADQHSGGENPMVSMTLAAAYAEAGQFPAAITAVQRALKLAAAQNNPGLASTLQTQLELYQASTPFHLPMRTDAPNKP